MSSKRGSAVLTATYGSGHRLASFLLVLCLLIGLNALAAPTSAAASDDYMIGLAAPAYSCGGPSFGPDLLEKPENEEQGDDGPSRALRREIDRGWVEPATGWIRAVQTPRTVVFLNDVRPEPYDFPFQEVSFSLRDGRWRWDGGGDCRPRMVEPGFSEAEWSIDRENPPVSDSSEISIMVTQMACSSGESVPVEDIKVTLIERDDAVAVGVVAEPSKGSQTCPGEEPTPYQVHLQEPLGQRHLVNNAVFVPRMADRGGTRRSTEELLQARQAACDATSSLMQEWMATPGSDTGRLRIPRVEALLAESDSTKAAFAQSGAAIFDRYVGGDLLFHLRKLLKGALVRDIEVMMANASTTFSTLNKVAENLRVYCAALDRDFTTWDIEPRRFARPGHPYPVIADNNWIVDGSGRGWDCRWTKDLVEFPDGRGICANSSSFEGATITGRVFAPKSLKPIAGARVALWISHEFSKGSLVARTNRYGEFSFHSLAAPYLKSSGRNCGVVRVRAEGRGMHELDVAVSYNERKVVGIRMRKQPTSRDLVPHGTRCVNMYLAW
jgi:hypothetical protein